jgi:hypothetical protein
LQYGNRHDLSSATLVEMLAHTKAKLPIQVVKPPVPCFFVEFPKGVLQIPDADTQELCDVDGMYVLMDRVSRFDDKRDIEDAWIADAKYKDCTQQLRIICVAHGGGDTHDWTIRHQSLFWKDDETETPDSMFERGRRNYMEFVGGGESAKQYDRETRVYDVFALRLAMNLCAASSQKGSSQGAQEA